MTLAVWLGFLLAAIVIAISPGPGAVLSMSTGMRHGYRAAFVTILGLQVALVIHLAIVVIGFGALLATSEAAFSAVKFIGAGYLIWLGIQKWRAAPLPVDQAAGPTRRGGLFLQGVLVNLTNPKAVIFIGALVPQFINPALPLSPQYLLISATLCLTDVVVMSSYALAAVHLGRWLRDPEVLALQNRAFGALFMLAGVILAASSRAS